MVNGNLKGIKNFIKERIEALDGASFDSSKFLDEELAKSSDHCSIFIDVMGR